jgi:hypothetical protein
MQFMVLFQRSRSRTTTPIPAELREAEFEKVRELYSDGTIRNIWLRDDVPGACMIVEANSMREIEGKLGFLPLVQSGFLESPTVVTLKPYAGFGSRSEKRSSSSAISSAAK